MQGFGTYKIGHIPLGASGVTEATDLPEHDMYQILLDALDAGFRLLDCADFYGNQSKIGEALEEIFSQGKYKREDVVILSKIWNSTVYEGPKAIEEKVDDILLDFRVKQLDICLVHWPVPGKHVEAYLTLEKLQRQGKVKDIGVSNYTIEDYQFLMNNGATVKPKVNQLEISPFLFREHTMQFFQNEGITIQAYRCLSNGNQDKILHPDLQKLANKYQCSPTQLCMSFILMHDIIPISKSVNKGRMRENYVQNIVQLEDADLATLKSLTTKASILKYKETYYKSCVAQTPKQGTAIDGKEFESGFLSSLTFT